jgi:hypothetical protein
MPAIMKELGFMIMFLVICLMAGSFMGQKALQYLLIVVLLSMLLVKDSDGHPGWGRVYSKIKEVMSQ